MISDKLNGQQAGKLWRDYNLKINKRLNKITKSARSQQAFTELNEKIKLLNNIFFNIQVFVCVFVQNVHNTALTSQWLEQ